MSERVHHCPFLNRSDARCSAHFSIDSLRAAFGHCLSAYAECPTYRELLAERRTRRGEPTDAAARTMFPGQSGPVRSGSRGTAPDSYASPIVPLTLTAADHRGAARRTVT